MPSEKIRVPFPIKGLDSSTQLDAQPPGTTRDARNVRGICPRTGRNRGAQRAPLEKYTTDTGPGSRTQALAVVSYDQARNKYTQLNNEPNVDVSPETVVEGFEWGKSPVETELHSVITDIHGNVYTLSSDRQIYKHSPDGELLDSLSIVGFETEEVVRRIQVDPLGNIYAATSRPNASTLYRFEPDEDVGYTTRYRWKSEDQIIDFQLKYGQIYAIAEKTTGTYRSYLMILYSLDSDIGPYSIFEKPVPSPVGGFAIGENGNIYVTCPKNPSRNTTPDSGDFGGGITSWTPYELGYNNDPDNPVWDGYRRIHSWHRADKIGGMSEGDELLVWQDSKQLGTKLIDASSPFQPIGDTVERNALQGSAFPQMDGVHNGASRVGYRKPPTFYVSGDGSAPGGFGGKPCVYFDGDDSYTVQENEAQGTTFWSEGEHVMTGQAMFFQPNETAFNRPTDLSDMANSTAPTPGANGVKYTTFIVARIDPDFTARCLYSNMHGGLNSNIPFCDRWNLMVNIGTDQTSSATEGPPWAGNSPGNLHLASGEGGNALVNAYLEDNGWLSHIINGTYATLTEGEYGTEEQRKKHPKEYQAGEQQEGIPNNTVIIAVHHGGASKEGNEFDNKSCWRVNGRQVGKTFTFRGDQGGQGSTSIEFSNPNSGAVLGAYGAKWQPCTGTDTITEWNMDDRYLYGGDSANTALPSNMLGWSTSSYNDADLFGFKGWVAEVVTVLGETGTEPNDTVPDDHINLDADGTGTGNTPDGGTITEVEKIEGYLAWRWGLERTLAPDHPFLDAPPDTTVDDAEQGDPDDVVDLGALQSPDPILIKYDGNNGELIWSMSAAGMGQAVVVDDKNQIITFGQSVDATITDSDGNEIQNENAYNPTTGALEPDATMRKVIDLGATFVADDVGDRKAWTINNDTIPENSFAYPQMFLDKSGDVYVPSDPLQRSGDDPDQMLGGGGVYKVNVSDGSIDFHIPSPVNYFMEGTDQSPIDGSIGVGSVDITQLPWSASGNAESVTRLYIQKFPNIAKHPITGDIAVSAIRDAPSPFPNTTYHGDADADGNFDYILPKYRNILYSDEIEPSLGESPTHEVVQAVDHFMEQGTLSAGGFSGLNHGWLYITDGGSISRDTATKSAPDLTRPYNVSGELGGTSKLSADGSNNHARMDVRGTTNRRVTNGNQYTFSVWIARDPELSTIAGLRTYNYARIGILQYKAGDIRQIDAIYNFSDGTINQTWSSGGGSQGGASGVQTITAAKELGSTDTQIWDRVYVTMPYDTGYSDGNLVCRIWPVCASNGAVSSSDRGAMHVWGPMLIEGTTPVSHNHPGWGSLNPTTEGNPSWTANVWLDGLTAEERASDGGEAVADAYPNHDSVLDTAIEPGDEIFFSFYLAKTAYDTDGELAGPTATDPNPTSIDEDYNTAQSIWIVTELRNRDTSVLESVTWHTQSNGGVTYVRNFDGSEGSGEWASQSTGNPYGHNVISEDAGDYWHVGFWFKYFSERSDGKGADLFRHQVHNSGSVENSKFTFCRAHPITGVELSINSGVHPDAPGGLQFPTPALGPNAPNAGSCLSVTQPFKSVGVDETGLNDDSEFEEKQKSPEFIYFTQRGNEPTLYDQMIRKHRIVAATSILGENQSPRANKLISVNNGSLYTVNTPSQEGDSYTAIEGGVSVLSAEAAQIQWTQHQGKLYFVDGQRVIVYDPLLDTVEDLESKDAGEVPKKPRLIASWRNRLILARTIDEPHNWHMSAIGDPENWDYFPALPVVTQAVSGNNARAGLASDLVNTLIPYNDDLMIMGGDHSIARMTGDPMAGGQIDVVSQTIGMAFGASWTIIPDGTLFFVSTEGRIFQMAPNGQIQKISNKFVEDAMLEDWNDALYRVKLVWNNKDDGLHVLFLPGAQGGEGGSSSLAMNALFWERVNNAWWRDNFAEDVTPYSAVVRDGDQPQDRTVLFGTSNGTVLNWAKQDVNSTTINDYNDNSINAWVFIDVASPTVSGAGRVRVTSAEAVMANYTENAQIELCAADDPMSLPANVVENGTAGLGPGTSGRLPLRGKGSNIGVRIKANSADSAFSMELLQLMITPVGRPGWLGGHEGHNHPEP